MIEKCEICGSQDNLVKHHVSRESFDIQLLCHSCHRRVHNNVPIVSNLNLKVRQYNAVVRLFVMVRNWKSSFLREYGRNPIVLNLKDIRNEKQKLAKQIKPLVSDELKKVAHIKGIGSILLAELLAYAHPNRFSSLRKFLHYCGFKESSVITKRYSRKTCSVVHQMAVSLVRHKDSHYYPLYLKIKRDLDLHYPNYTKAKRNGMAINRLGTFLLKELYRIFHD